MTDNTNIEALRPEFEEWAVTTSEGNCTDRDLVMRDGEYKNPLVERDFEVWCASRRAALSNAEPVGYLTQIGGTFYTAAEVDGVIGIGHLPAFLHPSVPAPLTPGRIYLIVSDRVFNKLGLAVVTDLVRTIEKAHGIGFPLTNTGEQG